MKELEVLYLTHPNIRDILVEGPSDARLIRWYLGEVGVSNARVYEVDDRVDAPREEVLKVHPEANKRGRLVYLAAASDSWGAAAAGVTCVVDADYDALIPDARFAGLLLTDYPAMEVYALQIRPFTKFLSQFTNHGDNAAGILSALLPVWHATFYLRFVLHRHSDGRALIARFAENCVGAFSVLDFEVRKLLQASAPGKAAEIDQLQHLYSDYISKGPAPSLRTVRGHDIAPVLIQYLNMKGDMRGADQVERLLRACIELVDVQDRPLFKEIVRRVTIGGPSIPSA